MNIIKYKLFSLASLIIISATRILAQIPTRPVNNTAEPIEDDSTLYYILLLVLVVGLIAAIYWLYKSRKAKGATLDKEMKEAWDNDSLDADKEMEWLRKHSKKIGKKDVNAARNVSAGKNFKKNKGESTANNGKDFDYAETQKKLSKMKFEKLPINSFKELTEAKPFDLLPIGNDEALMNAIDQTQDEQEEDENVRELAVKILAKFKTRNSIEALSDVALYDLSASLRSKAIGILADFDHESVFESLLLGCADPTREVRAASAKALFHVSFDRADAWARIAQSEDEYRIVQVARAAIESDLVDRSIDRLVHEDHNYAYEAFALIALLVKAGETEEIFQALENHRDTFVKLAILKVLKALKDERVLPRIYSYIERNSLPEDLSNAATEVIKTCKAVHA